MKNKGTLKVCENGHKFYKSSDCPTCPTCEELKKPTSGFLSQLSSPARRALEGIGVDTEEKLSKHTEKEILELHGFGPASLPALRSALKSKDLSFKNENAKI